MEYEQSGAVGQFNAEADTLEWSPRWDWNFQASKLKLSAAVGHVNALFGAEGLVVLDAGKDWKRFLQTLSVKILNMWPGK
jgi:hypothetical protein